MNNAFSFKESDSAEFEQKRLQSLNWHMKTDHLGEWTPAVKRRNKAYNDKYRHGVSEGALVSHESRSRFGYNYLEYYVK